MMKPPNAGERKKLQKIATYGLVIVSPTGGSPAFVAGIDVVAGIDDPGPFAAPPSDVMTGKGGGPAAGFREIVGKAGGVTRAADAGAEPSSIGRWTFGVGRWTFSSLGAFGSAS